tara:strand:- start:1403 stop:2335 length:933 start_codon:yes stop_codon:yes gene_type:complete
MRVAIIGRTDILLETAQHLHKLGYTIPLVISSNQSDYDQLPKDSYKRFAKTIKANYINTTNLNNSEVKKQIKSSNCDYAVSMNWATLIKPSTLDLFSKGILNIHPGDLPQYRGNATVNWAILNEEKKIGLTVHLMNEKLDEGPIVKKEFFKLNKNTYVGDVYKWIKEICPILVHDSLSGIERNTITLSEQSKTGVEPIRCYPRKPEDSRINWNQSTKDILKLIRASSKPFLGAYSLLEPLNKKTTIWKALEVIPEQKYYAISGQVCYEENDFPIVATKNGLIKIIEAEIDKLSSKDSLKLITSSLRNRLT